MGRSGIFTNSRHCAMCVLCECITVMKVHWFYVRSKTDLEPAHHANKIQPLSRIKTLNGPRVQESVRQERKRKGLLRKFPKSQVLSLEWKTKRVREDASGDHEDGEEDDDIRPNANSLFDPLFQPTRIQIEYSAHPYCSPVSFMGLLHCKHSTSQM